MRLYSKLNIKPTARHTALSQDEAEYLYRFIKRKKIIRTLEIGLAFGCSTAHIMTATRHLHYAIDPYQNSHKYQNLGLKNLQKLKLEHFLKFFPQHSQQVLPQLVDKQLQFDLIFHDGSHKFDDIFVDFFYSDLLLPLEKYIIFHDAPSPSVQMLESWITTNKTNYQSLRSKFDTLLIYKKTGHDRRKWHDFAPFGATRVNRISF